VQDGPSRDQSTGAQRLWKGFVDEQRAHRRSRSTRRLAKREADHPDRYEARVDRTACTGSLRDIEVAAFVSPKWAPQMADHEAIEGIDEASFYRVATECEQDRIQFPRST